MRLRRRFTAIVSVMAVLVGAVVMAPAGAQDDELDLGPFTDVVAERASGRTVVDTPTARVYDNVLGGGEANYVVIAEGSMFNVCLDTTPPPDRRGIFFQQANGLWTVKSPTGGLDVRTTVYKTDLAVFDFFDAVCGAFFGNGTPMPAPFAVGVTTLSYTERNIRDIEDYFNPDTPQGWGSYDNSAVGQVADADGNIYDLTAVADFKVRRSGKLVCDDCSVTLTPAAA